MTTNSTLQTTTLDTVQRLFAEVTRYPRELLEPNADLEEDLGIDSVKLGEILAVLRENFGLESRLTDDIKEIRTIATIANLLVARLDQPLIAPQTIASAVPAPQPATSDQQGLLTQVAAVVAEITRYPLELLTPTADLEEDLGIDSVKLGEILAVLRERFGIENRLSDDIREIRSITTIADLIQARLGETPSLPATATPIAAPSSEASNQQDLLTQVAAVVAEITRYPLELLTPTADLEEDLGIDSVKLGEILAVLRERFGVESRLTDDIREIRSIATIADLLTARLGQTAQPVAAQLPAESIQSVQTTAIVGEQIEHHPNATLTPTTSHKPYLNKIVLVTDSGHGLGKTIATHLARLGATVLINSFQQRELGEATTAKIIAEGGNAYHLWGSVADESHIEQLFKEIERKFGALDWIVSNAPYTLLEQQKDLLPKHWETIFQTNVTGLHMLALKSVPLMAHRQGGRIVAMSSNGAQQHMENHGTQDPVKAAMDSLIKYLAVELGEDNIRINSLGVSSAYRERLEGSPDGDRTVPYWEARTPGRQLCTEQDIANTVEFMLSDQSNMINGTNLIIDGGLSLRI